MSENGQTPDTALGAPPTMGRTEAPAETLDVSVIIPAYNAANTIAATLESLLSQTHARWEGIVVDDGSTDATADVARSFSARDSRFRMVTQANGGESAARNAGIAAARHDWLLFLDADDWIAPKHLERLTAELAAHPELDAVHCGYARVARDGTLVVEKYQPPAGDMFAILAQRAAFPVHTCVVRRSLVDEVGGFDTSFKKSPDWDLWQRVARAGARFGAVREVLAFYRMQPNSASLDARQLLDDGLRVLQRGHAADPRVPAPHPLHARGLTPEGIHTQQYYLLCWCAGLELGSGGDARPLLDAVKQPVRVDLYPDAIAQCIFESAPLSSCQPPSAWESSWPALEERIGEFLSALEAHTGTPELATRASTQLKRMVLNASPRWSPVISELEHARDESMEDRNRWQKQAEDGLSKIAELSTFVGRLEAERRQLVDEQKRRVDDLETRMSDLTASLQELERQKVEVEEDRERWRQSTKRAQDGAALLNADYNRVLASPEQRAGHFILNRLRFRRPARAAVRVANVLRQRMSTTQLAFERLAANRRPRVLATICWNFPIYSQTFVYEELTQLLKSGSRAAPGLFVARGSRSDADAVLAFVGAQAAPVSRSQNARERLRRGIADALRPK